MSTTDIAESNVKEVGTGVVSLPSETPSLEPHPRTGARDPIAVVVDTWELGELMGELDQGSEEAMRQYYCRRRIAEMVNAGLTMMRAVMRKNGTVEEIPDTACRATYLNFVARYFMPRPEKNTLRKRKEEDAPALPSEADFFAGLKGKPAVIRRLIDRLQGMLAEEGG